MGDMRRATHGNRYIVDARRIREFFLKVGIACFAIRPPFVLLKALRECSKLLRFVANALQSERGIGAACR